VLVLSRKKNEKIHIGDDVTVEILDIRSNGVVRLGIVAPIQVAVHREEVYNGIQRQKRAQE
jgi:carbon storage regulator